MKKILLALALVSASSVFAGYNSWFTATPTAETVAWNWTGEDGSIITNATAATPYWEIDADVTKATNETDATIFTPTSASPQYPNTITVLDVATTFDAMYDMTTDVDISGETSFTYYCGEDKPEDPPDGALGAIIVGCVTNTEEVITSSNYYAFVRNSAETNWIPLYGVDVPHCLTGDVVNVKIEMLFLSGTDLIRYSVKPTGADDYTVLTNEAGTSLFAYTHKTGSGDAAQNLASVQFSGCGKVSSLTSQVRATAYCDGGSGTEEDPYIIASSDTFFEFAKRYGDYAGKCYKLTGNVTLDSWAGLGTSTDWADLSFDGNGHTITVKNMTGHAFFEYLTSSTGGAVIKDLTLNVQNATNNTEDAAVFAYECGDNVIFQNCVAAGKLYNRNAYDGGNGILAGFAVKANAASLATTSITFSNCTVSVDLDNTHAFDDGENVTDVRDYNYCYAFVGEIDRGIVTNALTDAGQVDGALKVVTRTFVVGADPDQEIAGTPRTVSAYAPYGEILEGEDEDDEDTFGLPLGSVSRALGFYQLVEEGTDPDVVTWASYKMPLLGTTTPYPTYWVAKALGDEVLTYNQSGTMYFSYDDTDTVLGTPYSSDSLAAGDAYVFEQEGVDPLTSQNQLLEFNPCVAVATWITVDEEADNGDTFKYSDLNDALNHTKGEEQGWSDVVDDAIANGYQLSIEMTANATLDTLDGEALVRTAATLDLAGYTLTISSGTTLYVADTLVSYGYEEGEFTDIEFGNDSGTYGYLAFSKDEDHGYNSAYMSDPDEEVADPNDPTLVCWDEDEDYDPETADSFYVCGTESAIFASVTDGTFSMTRKDTSGYDYNFLAGGETALRINSLAANDTYEIGAEATVTFSGSENVITKANVIEKFAVTQPTEESSSKLAIAFTAASDDDPAFCTTDTAGFQVGTGDTAKYYVDFADAVYYAAANDTITLLDEYTLAASMTINKALTIACGEYTFTINSDVKLTASANLTFTKGTDGTLVNNGAIAAGAGVTVDISAMPATLVTSGGADSLEIGAGATLRVATGVNPVTASPAYTSLKPTEGAYLESGVKLFAYTDAAWHDQSYTCKIVSTGTEYETLADAIAAATSGDTIQMIEDSEFAFSGTYATIEGKAITLDLAGKTIKGVTQDGNAEKAMLKVAATGGLTFKDSVGGGMFEYFHNNTTVYYSAGYYAILNCGVMTMESGTIKAYDVAWHATYNEGDLVYGIENRSNGNSATLNITGGTICVPNSHGQSAVRIYMYDTTASGTTNTVNISGGTLDNVYALSMTSAEAISGGTEKGGRINLNISGGTFRGLTRFYLDNNNTSIKITGGNFPSTANGQVFKVVDNRTTKVDPIIDISGGSFDQYSFIGVDATTTRVTGGTFNKTGKASEDPQDIETLIAACIPTYADKQDASTAGYFEVYMKTIQATLTGDAHVTAFTFTTNGAAATSPATVKYGDVIKITDVTYEDNYVADGTYIKDYEYTVTEADITTAGAINWTLLAKLGLVKVTVPDLTDKYVTVVVKTNGETILSAAGDAMVFPNQQVDTTWTATDSKFFIDGTGTKNESAIIASDTELTVPATYAVLEKAADDTYHIGTITNLLALRAGIAGGKYAAGETFKLTGNIDLTGIVWPGLGNHSSSGVGDKPFTGVFDGAGYTISGVTLVEDEYIGFFAGAQNATIKNLTIAMVGMVDNGNSRGCGGLAGATSHCVISNVTTTGTLSGFNHTLGGFVVRDCESLFVDCTNKVNLSTSKNKVGGFVGFGNTWDSAGFTFLRCSNEGSVESTTDGAYIGGFVGNADDPVNFADCQSIGTLTGTGSNIGSFVGYVSVSSETVKPYVTAIGENTASSSVPSIGTADSGCVVSGLNFATVASEKATYVVADAIEAGGTYTVMRDNHLDFELDAKSDGTSTTTTFNLNGNTYTGEVTTDTNVNTFTAVTNESTITYTTTVKPATAEVFPVEQTISETDVKGSVKLPFDAIKQLEGCSAYTKDDMDDGEKLKVVTNAINQIGANGIKEWQNIVLGLTTSKGKATVTDFPTAAAQQTAHADKIEINLGNVNIQADTGATVSFVRIENDEAVQTVEGTNTMEIDLATEFPGSTPTHDKVKHYKFKVIVTQGNLETK